MLRKVLILTAVVSLFASSELQAGQISCSWLGCDDGLWGDPSNWSCGMVPDNNETNTFVVTIDTSGCPNEFEIRLQQNRTIDQLYTYGEVDLDVRLREDLNDIVLALAEDLDLTLTVLDGLTNHGFLEIEDLTISGEVLNASGACLGGHHDIYAGDLFNAIGARVECDEYYIDVHDGNIFNYGNLVGGSPGGGAWAKQEFQNFGEVEIYGGLCSSDQAFRNQSTSVIRGFGTLFSENIIRNEGAIYAYGGSLAVSSEGPFINMGLLQNNPVSSLHIKPAEDVNNQGTIEVNAGGGVAFDCNLVNEPNGVIKLRGGTLSATTITQSADANFAGFGGITGDVFIEPDGLIQLTGPTNIVGDVNIPANATLEISDGLTLITGHTTCNGTIRMKGGWIIPQGGLSGDCNIIWQPGIYTNVADFNLDGQVNFKDYAYFANTWLWQAGWY